jgi:hypothetical protein
MTTVKITCPWCHWRFVGPCPSGQDVLFDHLQVCPAWLAEKERRAKEPCFICGEHHEDILLNARACPVLRQREEAERGKPHIARIPHGPTAQLSGPYS